MAKTAVIYTSRYGHTKAYAEWIAKALGADLLAGAKPEALAGYDVLVFGGGLYAGGIGGARLLRDNFAALQGKKLVLFTVGLTDPSDTARFQPLLERAFPGEMQKAIHFFHLRGGIDYPRLSFLHRNTMRMLHGMLQRKKDRSREDEVILETYGARVNFLDKATIAPLLACVRGLEAKP